MALYIDTTERFPHLLKAPIVEAVLQISARASTAWTEDTVVPQVREAFPPGTQVISEQSAEQQFNLMRGVGLEHLKHSVSWQGVVIPKGERPEVIRFTRDFFSFSRLAPYEGWDPFFKRALELLVVYLRIASPHTAQRIGLRFINRIEISAGLPIEDYFSNFPKDTTGLDLPLTGFLHLDTFTAASLPYAINVGRTVQQSPNLIQSP
ncbi:MAG: TIGR04255 family protein, partial [Verrucomicrobia bacterium]|nr:TIGR04255 family protein [Verrucomicrobiota bacterium]